MGKGFFLAHTPADTGACARTGAHAPDGGAFASEVFNYQGALLNDACRQILNINPLNENYNYVENYRLE